MYSIIITSKFACQRLRLKNIDCVKPKEELYLSANILGAMYGRLKVSLHFIGSFLEASFFMTKYTTNGAISLLWIKTKMQHSLMHRVYAEPVSSEKFVEKNLPVHVI